MATGTTIEIITTSDISKCRLGMDSLMRESEPVAVDAEGESLSATGRLTLLQIGDGKGKVYVIDVVDLYDPSNTRPGKKLLEEGGVKRLLEDGGVLKVMHGSFNDSAALYCQFGIKLNNVFDTQCAYMAIEMSRGTHLPTGLRLDLLVEKYCGEEFKHSCKSYQDVWLKTDKFWGIRPLPKEAIEYAAEDVTVIYPHLYNALKSHLDEDSENFKELIFLELHRKIPAFKEQVDDLKNKRAEKAMRAVFPKIDSKYSMQTRCDELDHDEYTCLKYLRSGQHEYYKTASALIKHLEKQVAKKELMKVQKEVDDFVPSKDMPYLRVHPVGYFHLMKSLEHPDPSIRQYAKQVRAACNSLREPRPEKKPVNRGARGRRGARRF